MDSWAILGDLRKKEMHVGHQIKRMNKKDITYRQQGFALLPKWRRLQKRLCSKLFEKIGPVMHFLLLKRERPLQKLVFSLPSQLQSFCLGSWVIYTQTNINFILKFFNEQFLLGLLKITLGLHTSSHPNVHMALIDSWHWNPISFLFLTCVPDQF